MISDNARVDFSEKLANLFEERLKMLENKFPVDVQEVESLKYLFFDTCVYSFRSYQEEVKEFVGDSVSHVSHPTTKDAKTNTRESASSNTLTIPKIDNKINSANGKKTASSSQSSNNNHTSRSKTPIISPYQMKTDRDRSRTPVNNTPKDKVSSSKKSLIEGNPKTNLTAAKERKVSSFVTESTKIKTPTHQKNSSMITGEKKIETHYRTRSIISQPHPILIHDTISNNKEKKRRTDLSPVNIHSNKKNGIKLGFNTTTHHQMSKSQHLSESIKIEEPIKSTRIDNSEKIASSPSKEELNNEVALQRETKTVLPRENAFPKELDDKYLRGLYLMLNSNFLVLQKKFQIMTAVPKLYKTFKLTTLIEAKIGEITDKIKLLEDRNAIYFNDPTVDNLINKNFVNSKTAQNGLAFVTSEEESNLCKKEQPEEIGLLFKVIYLLLNEQFDPNWTNQVLIDNLINVILPQMEIKGIKNLFINHICKNLIIDEERYEAMYTIIANNPRILSSPDMMKINRAISYMTFIFKEIFEYLSQKTSDGVFIFTLRKIKSEIIQLKAEATRLQNLQSGTN